MSSWGWSSSARTPQQERAPLLEEHDQQRDEQAQPALPLADKPVTPLPKLQLFILCLMRISEPISFTCLFPFVNEMVHRNMPHVPRSQIGYYAGGIESSFAIVQLFTVFWWGRLSDSIGRKPVLMLGLTGVFASMQAFGLAKSFPAMIVARCISGAFNGNVGVLKSALGEITDSTNQARAFTLIPLSYAIGSIIGPSIGGYFADWPLTPFLAEHPYYLPCFIASLFNLASIVLGFLFFQETLPSKVRRAAARKLRDAERSDAESAGLLASESDEGGRCPPTLQHRMSEGDLHSNSLRRSAAKAAAESLQRRAAEDQREEEELATKEAASKPSLRSLVTPDVRRILLSQMLLNTANISYSCLMPLFCYEPVSAGGIGFSNLDIGHILAANGVAGIFVQLVAFPKLERYLGGPLPTIRRVFVGLPLVFACFPVAHWAAKHYGRGAAWVVIAIMLVLKASTNMGIVCSTLLVNNAAPVRSALGALNGLSQTCSSFARAVGPAGSTSLFAWSVNSGWLGGSVVWIVLCSGGFYAWTTTYRISINHPQWEEHSSSAGSSATVGAGASQERRGSATSSALQHAPETELFDAAQRGAVGTASARPALPRRES